MAGPSSSPLTLLPGSAPATLGDWQYQIDNVVLGRGTNYLITGRDGSGTPEVRNRDVARPAEDGDWMGIDTYASRTITVNMTIRGTSVADVMSSRDALVSAWRNDPSVPYTQLWWKLPGMPAKRAIGRPRRIQVAEKLVNNRLDAVAEFYTPFSALFGETVTVTGYPLVVTGGGLTYPVTFPITYAVSTSGGAFPAPNPGTYPSWAVMTFTGGNCVAPRVTDLNSGRYIAFDVSLAPTDVLVVDLKLRTATLNGKNVRQYKSPGSNWFPFPPGQNASLYFSAKVADASCMVDVTYAPAHLA